MGLSCRILINLITDFSLFSSDHSAENPGKLLIVVKHHNTNCSSPLPIDTF